MSVECSECEWDARAGHHEECSRHPRHIIPRQRAEIARLTERCDAYREALGEMGRVLDDARQQIEHFREHGWLPNGATERDFGEPTLELIAAARKFANWQGEDMDYYAALENLRVKLAALASPAGEQKCPTCDSPKPELHPAMQFEGEVQICRDPWHQAPAGEQK